jgi:asparagine synthase (glutamine-hydrolysing)
MCGIIGEIQKTNPVNVDQFDALRDLLFHRGPDGAGTELLHDSRIALGHRRLSIIDLTDNAKQPMCNEDGSIWITFNGEIYNFQELKAELSQHTFKSNSDTEVLIHGYEQWGIEKLLEKVKGMFAFGVWDDKKQQLVFARDRFGIKPFVYQHSQNHFIFASEVKCIAHQKDFSKNINQDALADYFNYSYIPYPLTIWDGVYKLPPAHYGVLDFKTFELQLTKYWDLSLGNSIVKNDVAIEKAHELIDNATRQHLISDVPIGLFLSGGYDSTTLLMKMLDLGYKPDVFTIGFPGHENDETNQAKAIAKHFGVKHFIEDIPLGVNVVDLLQELSVFYDEPFAGNSMINNHLIAKTTVKHAKVAFSGEGADEVFGGYKWHRKIEKYYEQGTVKRHLRNWRLGIFDSKTEFLKLYNRSMLGVLEENSKCHVVNQELTQKMNLRELWHFEEFYNGNLTDKVKQAQNIDTHTFIPNHCLHRADLSSMANSLEVRVPFLDHEIYEYVFSLNRSVYMKKGSKKFLLEEKLKNRIPDSVLNMPKKGFSFHFSENNFQKEFDRILENGLVVKYGILNKVGKQKIELSEHFKFHLVNLEFWLKNHFE